MVVTDKCAQAMRDSEASWNRLVATAKASPKTWTPDQLKQIELLADILAKTHNALKFLIDANDEDP